MDQSPVTCSVLCPPRRTAFVWFPHAHDGEGAQGGQERSAQNSPDCTADNGRLVFGTLPGQCPAGLRRAATRRCHSRGRTPRLCLRPRRNPQLANIDGQNRALVTAAIVWFQSLAATEPAALVALQDIIRANGRASRPVVGFCKRRRVSACHVEKEPGRDAYDRDKSAGMPLPSPSGLCIRWSI